MLRTQYPRSLGLERLEYPLPPQKSFPAPKPPAPQTVLEQHVCPLLPHAHSVQLPKSGAWGRVTMRLPEERHARLGGRARGVSLKLLHTEVAGDGLQLQLLPSGSTFLQPVRLCFSVRSLLPEPEYEDGREEGVLLVMRQRKGEQWLPLIGRESLSVAADGTATVQLRSSGSIRAQLFSGAEGAARAAAIVAAAIEETAKALTFQPVARANQQAPPPTVASASPSVVNLVIKYASMAAGAPLGLGASGSPTGGLAGLAVPVISGAIGAIATDPQAVARFAKDLEGLLRDPHGGALRALERAAQEVAAHK